MRSTRAVLLLALVLVVAPTAAAAEKPAVLVTGFQVTGKLLQEELSLDLSMEVVTEAILAERFAPVSGLALAQVCAGMSFSEGSLLSSVDHRLAAAKALGAKYCVSGWATSFGSRIVITVEVIDVEAGLPGRVKTVMTEGLEKIPDALAKVLGMLGLTGEPGSTPPDGPTAKKEFDLREVWSRIPVDDLLDTYPSPEYEELVEMRENAESPRCDEETYRRAEELLAASVEHMKRLHNDRDYRDEYVVRLNMARDPIFKDFDLTPVRHGPYLLFVEMPGDHIKPLLEALGRLYAGFPTVIGDAIDLPEARSGLRAHERLLKVLVFDAQSTFRHYQKKLGTPLPQGVTGYYRLSNQWLTVFLPKPEGAGSSSEAGMRRIAHEATHQLFHRYAKLVLGRELGEEVIWTDPRIRSKASWLFEGMAELLSEAAAHPGEFNPAWIHGSRLKEWSMNRDRKLGEWTLAEIVRVRTIGELRARSARKGLGHQGRLSSLYFAQAWSFCHFLWSFEDGKYREKLRELLQQELHGNSGYEVFRKVFFGEGELDSRDLEILDREWNTHVETLFEDLKSR